MAYFAQPCGWRASVPWSFGCLVVGVAAAELAADQRRAARLPVWIEQERLLVRRRVQQLTVGRRVKLAGQLDQSPFGERPNGMRR